MWLVLGSRGFLGSWVARGLREKNIPVVALKHDEMVHRLDCCMNKLDGVINCAGINRGEDREIIEAHSSFPMAVVNQLASWDNPPKLIHVASERVYGWKEHPKESPGYPDPVFGDAKVAAENYLLETYPKDKLCIVRPTNVYGPGSRPNYNTVVATWVALAAAGEPLRVDTGCVRDFLWVGDLVRAFMSLVEDWKAGVFDLRSGRVIDIERIAEVIAGLGKVTWTSQVGATSIPATSGDFCAPAVDALEAGILAEDDLTPMLDGLVMMWKAEKVRMRLRAHTLEKRGLEKYEDERGRMVELFDWKPARVFEITFGPSVVRGGHYHLEQLEDFYVSHGEVHWDLEWVSRSLDKVVPGVLDFRAVGEDRAVTHITPRVVHTLWNPDPEREALVIIGSSQAYVKGDPQDVYRK